MLKMFDKHVVQAWRTEKFSDGKAINHRKKTDEQGFLVYPDGIFEAKLIGYEDVPCRDGRVVSKGRLLLPKNSGFAAGHTHPRGHEAKPGPLDGVLAKSRASYDSAAYMIGYKGAYRIEFSSEANLYYITTLAGSNINQRSIKKLNRDWSRVRSRGSFRNDDDYVCQ